jgi:hypothetical protein
MGHLQRLEGKAGWDADLVDFPARRDKTVAYPASILTATYLMM